MTSWIQIFLDTPADRLEEAVGFWAAVTGWTPSERRGEDGPFLTLVPAAAISGSSERVARARGRGREKVTYRQYASPARSAVWWVTPRARLPSRGRGR